MPDRPAPPTNMPVAAATPGLILLLPDEATSSPPIPVTDAAPLRDAVAGVAYDEANVLLCGTIPTTVVDASDASVVVELDGRDVVVVPFTPGLVVVIAPEALDAVELNMSIPTDTRSPLVTFARV